MEPVDQQAIFAPFLTMMLLTLLVWLTMYARRLPFIMREKLGSKPMTTLELMQMTPPAVTGPAENLNNLFETPTLFYALLIFLYVTARVDQFALAAAWVFVIFRVLHSAVHCTINIIPLRFALYCLSTFSLWLLVVRELWKMLG